MKASDSIANIAPALLAAQQKIEGAVAERMNEFTKKKYADLQAVIAAVKPALNEAGIVFMQSATESPPMMLCLTTRLLHTSGEWFEDTLFMPLVKNDPQSYGAAMTYARRYALSAITGLHQEDDDAESAVGKKSHAAKKVSVSAWEARTPDEQNRLTSIADECRDMIKAQQVDQAVLLIKRADLDADNGAALWSLFDSKERSAIKKETEKQRSQNGV